MKTLALHPAIGIGLTTIAMLAFAGNALLTRAAFQYSDIDAASFTLVRLLSGAIVLSLLIRPVSSVRLFRGNWISALALLVYAVTFSFAFMELTTATGALLGFAAIQLTMLGFAIWQGERFSFYQKLGLLISMSGLVALLLPGLQTPAMTPALLMLVAGVAWGVYTLLGKQAGDPVKDTAANFTRAALLAGILFLLLPSEKMLDTQGFIYACLSGAVTSGVGYILWYMALPYLTATIAASVQLTVPVLAALGGVVFFNEMISLQMVIISGCVLGGIALVVSKRE